MKRKNLMLGVLGAALVAGATFGTATAATDTDTQTIDATLSSTVSMTLSSPSVSWALSPNGANTKAGGTASVAANTSYTVTVVAAKATLTQWDPSANEGAGAYGSAALASATTLAPTLDASSTGTLAVAGAGGPVGNNALTPTAVATGGGGGTDVYNLSLGQTTTLADDALPSGHTYRNVFTYTTSTTI